MGRDGRASVAGPLLAHAGAAGEADPAALVNAARRGVHVSIITAGVAQGVLDRLVRQASRAHFPRASRAGIKIHEYGPALLHAKTMVIDDRWISIGSANLDNRSFALNNELNLVFQDRGLARRLVDVFQRDLAYARPLEDDELKEGLDRFFYLPLLPLRDQL